MALFVHSFSKTAEEWKTRSIYQLMTDRFAKTDDDTTPCKDFLDYCGGTFKGIEKNLDYIQGMGFNAIWISPVQKNGPKGYHGYWAINFYEINEKFGTEQDFIDLVKACHNRDIWVMIDIVANHIGYLQDDEHIANVQDNDYSKVVPFNDPSYFHEPLIECDDGERKFPGNQTVLETCWLHWLPDLNQSHPFVRKALTEWISWFVKTYEIDAIRLDALRHVSKDFWVDFREAAGVFTIGEVFDYNVGYLSQYQGPIDSPINFPFHSRLFETFLRSISMKRLAQYYEEAYVAWPDITTVTNFLNVHDNPRFLYKSGDVPALKAAITFSTCSIGISTFYYGDEQAFAGGQDPANREPLWTKMDPNSEVYQFIKVINTFKHSAHFYQFDQIERFVDDSIYAFSRGPHFFAFTNRKETQTRVITNHPYKDETWLCSIFDVKDCTQVQGGKFTITFVDKEVRILTPSKGNEESEGKKESVFESIKNLVASGLTNDPNSSV